MAVAVVGFVFPHAMQSFLEESFTDKIIHSYRDDADLQNFIDFAQAEVINTLGNKLYQIKLVFTKYYVSVSMLRP